MSAKRKVGILGMGWMLRCQNDSEPHGYRMEQAQQTGKGRESRVEQVSEGAQHQIQDQIYSGGSREPWQALEQGQSRTLCSYHQLPKSFWQSTIRIPKDSSAHIKTAHYCQIKRKTIALSVLHNPNVVKNIYTGSMLPTTTQCVLVFTELSQNMLQSTLG